MVTVVKYKFHIFSHDKKNHVIKVPVMFMER